MVATPRSSPAKKASAAVKLAPKGRCGYSVVSSAAAFLAVKPVTYVTVVESDSFFSTITASLSVRERGRQGHEALVARYSHYKPIRKDGMVYRLASESVD